MIFLNFWLFFKIYQRELGGKKLVELKKLPPTEKAAKSHLKRVYLQVSVLKGVFNCSTLVLHIHRCNPLEMCNVHKKVTCIQSAMYRETNYFFFVNPSYLFLNSRCKSGKEILFLLTNMDGRRRRMGPGLPNRAMAIYALRPLLQCLNVIARRLVKLWPVPARRVVLIALNAATAPRTARTNTPFKNSLMTAMIRA